MRGGEAPGGMRGRRRRRSRRRGHPTSLHQSMPLKTQHAQELERSDSISVCACCPICKRSLQDNSATWRYLDSMAASHPLPEEYVGWQAEIFCNDCL